MKAVTIGKMLIDGPKGPIGRDMAEAMAKIGAERHLANKPIVFTEEQLVAAPVFRVIQDRCRRMNVKVTDDAIAIVGLMCNTFGVAVLYCAALKAISATMKYDQEVNFDDVSLAFADGFPCEENLHTAWKAQKKGGGNWLDDPEAWKP